MTPHPNSNSSWCYFYMIFKVNHISTNSGSWVSYIITMLSQAPNTIYCSAAFMTFYNLFLIFIALLFIVFISSSCTPVCTHLSIPKHFPSVPLRHTKVKGQGPPSPWRCDTVCWPQPQAPPRACLSGWMGATPGGSVLRLSEGPLLVFVGMGKNTSGSPCTMHHASHMKSLKLNFKLSHL